MGKLFRVNTVNSDGSEAGDRTIPFEVIDPSTSKPFMGDDGKPSVVILLRPISQSKYRQIQAENTERVLNKKTRSMEDITNWDAVQDECVVYAIQSWSGVIGADDRPLQCVHEAKVGLPGDLKNELVQRSMQGESVDAAASFRATA